MANYTPKPRVARIGTDPRVLSPVVRGGGGKGYHANMKVLLNRGTLAATLMTMVAFATMPAQAQTTFAVAYDSARLNDYDDTLHGLAVTGDRVVWREHLTVSGTVSHIIGKGWTRVSRTIAGVDMPTMMHLDVSRTYMGVGLGVRVGTSVQMFAHVLFGALRPRITIPYQSSSLGLHISGTKYGERYGVGIDIPIYDQGFVRAAVNWDGKTHSIVGIGWRI